MIIPQGSLILSTQVIASGMTTTPGFATDGASLCGIQLPATFTGSSITFLAATTLGGTYQPVYNSAGQVSYTVTQGQYIAINPVDFYGIAFLQIKSSSTEGASRTLVCSLKGI